VLVDANSGAVSVGCTEGGEDLVKLIVVESPRKAQQIAKYLGSGYQVFATVGHFRDLPEDRLGVDTKTFELEYQIQRPDVARRLQSAARIADEVVLATDVDREGEAIAWHVAQLLGLRDPRRARFREVTPVAIKAALSEAGSLNQHLVNAQQTRRGLDRLVGYEISPLFKPLGPGHGTGRVQSATLHLVVVREFERERFQAEPYWTLLAQYREGFSARYAEANEKGELTDTRLRSEAEAEAVAAEARAHTHTVCDVETVDLEQRPKEPFRTATLQQAASSVLELAPEDTMRCAQALFERGHITYHRTDSAFLSADAVHMARTFIERDYPEGLPAVPPEYSCKADSQGAHEAIRPTQLDTPLEELHGQERGLFQLIRRRFLACQCKPAVRARTTVVIRSGESIWRTSGAVVTFEGYLHYQGTEEQTEQETSDQKEVALPKLQPEQVLGLETVEVKRQETRPPPRYTYHSLIKDMERKGVGRPATYAPTLSRLFEHRYLERNKKHLFPSQRGRLVDGLLEKAFPNLVEVSYTARMEDRLDEVEAGTRSWRDELRLWYQEEFAPEWEKASRVFHDELVKLTGSSEVTNGTQMTERPCPRCGGLLMMREGKHGPFLSCSSYPKCTYTASPNVKASEHTCPVCRGVMEEEEGKFGSYARCVKSDCGGRVELGTIAEEKCPKCGSSMRDRGTFLGCTKYPECRATLDKKAVKAGRRCPKCKRLMQRRQGTKGAFWGCSGYPECTEKQWIPDGPKKRSGRRVSKKDVK